MLTPGGGGHLLKCLCLFEKKLKRIKYHDLLIVIYQSKQCFWS